MKKIVAMGAIAALAGGMIFADEPAVDIKLAEFNGNATAKWGVDLDAGQTGFTNTEGDLNIKLNLWNEGEKSTTGDGIWGEIKIKGKALAIRGKDGRSANNVEVTAKQSVYKVNADIPDTADANGDGKIDFAEAYTYLDPADDPESIQNMNFKGKKAGDVIDYEEVVSGKMKDWDGDAKVELDTAKIHFGDKFYIGIKKGDAQVGEYKFDGAIRSADNDNAKWLLNVGPDKFSQGIVVGYGDDNFGVDVDIRSYFDDDKTFSNYTNSYAFAAEAKLKDTNSFLPGLFVDVGAGYNLSDKFEAADKKTGKYTTNNVEDKLDYHNLGYTAQVGYKLSLDDKKYVKPVVGLTGSNESYKTAAGADTTTVNSNYLVAGAIYALGETKDSDAGVYFLDDGDQTKKITPGFSVVAAIPLPETTKTGSNKSIQHNAIQALIVPSVYLNSDVVEGLKLAAYSEMAFLRNKAKDSGDDHYAAAKDEDRAFAFAIAAGAAYDIKSGDLTITPKAGVRFANASYFENNINSNKPLDNNKVFVAGREDKQLGEKNDTKADEGYLNVKAGLDVNGLIDNTTVFVEYSSANLLNSTDYNDDYYKVKLGTINIGAKIHF